MDTSRTGARASRKFLLLLALMTWVTGAALPVEAQPLDPARTIQTYFESVRDLDYDRFVTLFTPDGRLEDPVGTPAYRGHKALREWIESIGGPFEKIDVVLQRVLIVTPTDAAVWWTTYNHLPDGRVLDVHGIGIYRFNEDGLIRDAREYWDMPGLLARMTGTPYTPPAFVSEALARQYFGLAETFDVEGTIGLFRPEGILSDPVGTAPYHGHKAIREYLAGLAGPFTALDFTLDKVIPTTDGDVAVAWTAKIQTRDGRTVQLPGIGVFQSNDGKLSSVEEYWRVSDLLGQL